MTLLQQGNAEGVSDELGRGTSYTLVRGADSMRPASVLLVTRNWSGDNLGSGHWLGADSDSSNLYDRTMSGLNESQGQVVQMDGSAKQSHNADFGDSGQITSGANQATGGNAKGATSLNILRGAGL